MLLQVVVGGVAAVGVTAKLYWRRIRSVFRTGAGDSEHQPEP